MGNPHFGHNFAIFAEPRGLIYWLERVYSSLATLVEVNFVIIWREERVLKLFAHFYSKYLY
jgi:hypothetical protein